jgi:hypothetical protein
MICSLLEMGYSMRTIRSLFAGILSVFSVFAPMANAQSGGQQPPLLDYARTIRESGMVFIPYQGMNLGPVYYTEYDQVPTATAAIGGLRRLFVNLRPTAHTRNLYNDFVRRHGITDARVLPAPAAEACKPSEGITALLSEMPVEYRPRILSGGYPVHCTLSVYFLPEREAEVRSLIDSSRVIKLNVSVPLCAASSPLLDVPRIVDELRGQGVLNTTDTGAVTGQMWSVLYASSLLARNEPALFVTADPQEGWRELVKQFSLDLVSGTATLSRTKASSSRYICTPEPLEIQF